ncbi:PREDICTED: probable purine permease 11 [Theobroma cacao]|uniref:Probable purine permease n=1 Tax=Theobroma cacao TaxID=3641 RepID=A0AB32WR58_THECC|nr:PREDICTED: probable purine permease 11 [Theobroma cacao]
MDAIEAQQDSKSEIGTLLPDEASTATDQLSMFIPDKRWKWWVLVVLNIAFLLLGQSVAVLLGKFYFKHGHSKWLGALVQTAGFPVLFLALVFFPSPKNLPSICNNTSQPSLLSLILVYFSLGCLLAIDNFLYSVGLWSLPISTYSLICASQLVFNAIFSLVINSEKLTILILKSVTLLIISASLVAIHPDSSEREAEKHSGGKKERVIGILCTVGASAAYALLLSLTQFCFEKVLKKESFSVVFEMQIYTSLVSTFVCIVGLFASSEWKKLNSEMETFKETFKNGRVLYVLSLVGAALAWQICTVGVVGLIFLVSSLFSNFVSMLCLPFVPVVGVLFYHEKMDGIKVLAMLLTIWGFASYLYQQYLDDNKPKDKETGPTPGIEESKLDGSADALDGIADKLV